MPCNEFGLRLPFSEKSLQGIFPRDGVGKLAARSTPHPNVISKNVIEPIQQLKSNNLRKFNNRLDAKKFITEIKPYFSFLLESDYEFLKYVAIEYANEITSGYQEGNESDCGYYLINYFKGKEKIKIENPVKNHDEAFKYILDFKWLFC